MAKLLISEDTRLEIGEGCHWSCGSIQNEGYVYGEGTLGLDWSEPIIGYEVYCSIVEENIPEVTAKIVSNGAGVKTDIKDIGGSYYDVTLDEGERHRLSESEGTIKVFQTSGEVEDHIVTVGATNSREYRIEQNFTTGIVVIPCVWRVTKDVISGSPGGRGQIMGFMARIQEIETQAYLWQQDVQEITMKAFRLVKNTFGIGREPVEGFENNVVDIESIQDIEVGKESRFWTRDKKGFNFMDVPDQILNYLAEKPGAYQVEYEIRLKSNNPIKICYDFNVV